MKRWLTFLAVVSISRVAGASSVTDPAGWSLAVPDRYRAQPATAGALYSFAQGAPTDADFSAVQVRDLGGTISNEPIDTAAVERSARESVKGTDVDVLGFAFRKIRWRTFELDAVVSRMRVGDRSLVSLAAQVPLVPHAIQIVIAGPVADTDRLTADLTQILSSVDGTSSWLSDAERAERLGEGIGMAIGFLGAVGLLWAWRRRRRRRSTSPVAVP